MTGRPSPGLVLAAMTLANAMILVDQTAVPLTLPDIMGDFGVGSQAVQWVLTASLLSLAGLLVLGGRLGDQLGRRRVFLTGAMLFVGSSTVAGLAPQFEVLVAARVLQGAGGALMLPVSVAIVSAAFPAERRGRALGTMGGTAAVAGALGPTIGGVLDSVLSWRAVLPVNIPLAAGCIGAALLCAALVGLVLGLGQTQDDPVASAPVLAPLAVAAAAAVVFWRHERRTAEPLMSFALLGRHRNYLGATVSQGLAGMAEMGVGVLFPLILILNLGMDPGRWPAWP